MAGASGRTDIKSAISYCDNVVKALKNKKDINNLTQCLQHSRSLRSSADADFTEAHNFLRDYERKVEACKQKTAAAKAESVADEELDLLQRELDDDVEQERLLLEELRAVTSRVKGLERHRVAVQEKKKMLKKHEQDEFRAQRKLSMYASVTNIIPNMDDQSRIMGYIVDRDTKQVQDFEFDTTQMTGFETCDSIWKMITPR